MGYSRAVRAGSSVFVAGCVGIRDDGSYPPDLRGQTSRCLERVADALRAFELTLGSIVRIRIYTTQIDRWEEIASVVGPSFAETRPANLLVGVAALVDPRAMIEIEADAWTGGTDRTE